MIRKIAIRNYQSLVNVSLELGRITVIVGHTDSGKSSFIRAVERACFNDSGYDFLTVDENGKPASTTQVAIQTDNGTVIWERTRTTVKYRAVTADADRTFTKLGRSYVPDEVHKLLGVRSIQVDAGNGNTGTQRIQFSGQFDLPFLVADRGGVAASRVLGRLTGVNIFSHANKKLTSQKSQLNTRHDALKTQHDEKVAELIYYEGLEQKRDTLAAAQLRLAELNKKSSRLGLLKALAHSATQNNLKLAVVGHDVNAKLRVLDSLVPHLRTLWNKLNALTGIYKLSSSVERWSLSRMQVESTPSPPKFDLRDSFDLHQSLMKLRSDYQNEQVKISAAESECRAAYDHDGHCLIELDKFNNQFPLCPFVEQFPRQEGVYRCRDLMSVLDEQ